MEIVWTDFAIESLSEIISYIESFFCQKTADNAALKIIAFVETLAQSPCMGKPLLYLSKYGDIRCVFYKQNHIYYQIIENRIEILIIWDGRQDPDRLRNILNSLK